MVSFASFTLRQTIRNNTADMQENYYENLHNLIIMLAGILWTCFIILPSFGRIFKFWYQIFKVCPCVIVFIHMHAAKTEKE